MTYHEEEQSRLKVLRATIEAILPHLPGWTLEEPKEEQSRYGYNLLGPNAYDKLVASIPWNAKDRISFSGQYPNGGRHGSYLPYKETAPSITVSRERGPEKIAADVTRRLLPPYNALMLKVLERKTNAENYDAQIATLRARLCNILDEKDREESTQIDLRGAAENRFYGDITVSNDSASVKLHNLRPNEAEEVCRLIRRMRDN